MRTKIILLLLVITSGVLLTGCSIIGRPAGLKVETDQPANVFINGKIMGKTPYENPEIKGKEITLKIIPEITEKPLVSWESKVSLLGGTWTTVKRELAVTESDSSGQVLFMTTNKNSKTASISVVTEPEGATVLVNREEKGVSPYSFSDLSPADYTVEVVKDGYVSRNMKLKLLAGYQLNIQVKLGQVDLGANPPLATVSGQPSVTPGKATPTAGKTTPTPTKPATISVTPTKATGIEPARPYVLIKETEVGFLRVREKPSTGSTELTQVKPGEKYALLDEENGWYKIAYLPGKEGWVAGQYVTKYE